MKLFLVAILLTLFSGQILAQDSSVEKNFEKKRPKLVFERFSEGEDASSGFDYLFYKDKSEIIKVRQIWSSSAGPQPRGEDFYFEDGKPVLYVRFSLEKKQLKDGVKGKNVPIKIEEQLYLKNSILTRWIENGKTISASDPRWNEKEKEILAAAKGQLELYQSFKDENN